jgi:alanine racemase
VSLPIAVLSPLLPAEIEEAVAHRLEPSVGDRAFAGALSAAAQRDGRPQRFHVEVDTGMGRTGVPVEDAAGFLADVTALPGLRLASLYTHFPDADSGDLAFADQQVERFKALVAALAKRGIRPPRLHAANSAGTVNVKDALFDWVRLGLIAYGHSPPRNDAAMKVQPVMSFKSRIVQLRDHPAGTPISYARTFVTARQTRVGVVAVGYGHGS